MIQETTRPKIPRKLYNKIMNEVPGRNFVTKLKNLLKHFAEAWK